VCSADWVDKFTLRLNFSCGNLSGKARAVNCDKASEWLSAVWPELLEGYPVSGIFSADETGLFLQVDSGKDTEI
jgi:hypothetical protein